VSFQVIGIIKRFLLGTNQDDTAFCTLTTIADRRTPQIPSVQVTFISISAKMMQSMEPPGFVNEPAAAAA